MSDAEITEFGTTADGRPVRAVTLRSEDLTARILTWGAVLQGLWLKGVAHSLTLGSERLADYEGPMIYHGSLVAPVANRISGARAVLDGRELTFEKNHAGRMTLHSGSAGTQTKVWSLAAADARRVVLSLDLADGEGGFPGNRHVEAIFEVTGATLRLTISATTDRPTFFNATNHSYWNLDGSATWQGHQVRVAAEERLLTDAEDCATGEIEQVAGSAYDFRSGAAPVPGDPPIDHCFVLSRARRALTPVMWLTGQGGVTMEVATTEPGLQLYDARGAMRPGRAAYEGIAIEAQGWPDAPNQAGFPSIVLRPGETIHQVTEWRFLGI
ncbi:galactose mutarotase [Frigidibacter sp. RF13]|uniref:aldose epimerase family protein n=1 Tax=Frigidibacter sp. RF13 TaxID=2997340 RepID=UPI00226EB292|nr:aldose epimerase family protein [Frigidibacter sp. RF13]MCY1127390.1 galactose mutarotase [Frigidibacter sp. RF13]